MLNIESCMLLIAHCSLPLLIAHCSLLIAVRLLAIEQTGATNAGIPPLTLAVDNISAALKAVDREFPNFGFWGIFDISWIFVIYGTLGIDA